jgi:hypothetical protein
MSKNQPQPKAKPTHSKQELPKSFELKFYPNSWYYVCWIIYLLYCYAAFAPTGPVWGIHFIAYIPVALKLVLLMIGGVVLLPNVQQSLFIKVTKLFGAYFEDRKVRILPAIIVAGVCFILFRTFTIKTDIYGDTINMLKWYGANTVFDWSWITDVISPHWVDNKEALTVAVHRLVAYSFSIPIESSYRIMSEVFGALFIFVWLLFVQKISSGALRIVLILLGLFAGAVQVFFGHVENYPFGILTSTIFLVALYYYIEGKIGTLVFVFAYLLAFKAHIIAILFFPAFLVALAFHYREKLPKLQSLFTWRSVLFVVIVPAFFFGVTLYIFLFHSWNEPYSLSVGRQFQQTFLQVVTLPAPLDHYSLWSPYHVADFINLLLLVSSPIIVVIANVMIFNRKEISWSQPKVIIFGLAALFPFMFFMAMNPTLSPVRDWDVYTLLFPPLLFFASILLIQSGVRPYAPAWLGQSLVFGVIFTTVLIAVNSSTDELVLRLQDAGAYTYRSYYGSSGYIEGRSLALNDTDFAVKHFSKIVENLAKVSNPGKDEEMADMMSRLASLYNFDQNDSLAIYWASEARKTDTRIHRYVADLAAYYVQANRLAEGSRVLNGLLKNRADRHDTDNSYIDEMAATMAQLAARYSRTADDSSTRYWATMARTTEPNNVKYIYDLADYYMQTEKPLKALEQFRSIPPDSLSVEALTGMSMAEAYAYGPDSGLIYLFKARKMSPNNRSIDSLIFEMKMPQSPSR